MNKKIWIPLLVIVIIVAALIVAWRWLYFGQLTDQKIKVFSKVPLPAALVGTSGVSMKETLNRKALAETVYGQNKISDLDLVKQIVDQLIANAQTARVAAGHKISASPQEIDQEYQAIIAQAAGGDQGQFEKSLQETYHLTPADFKSKVVSQELLNNKLQAWYNGQQKLNSKEYETIADIQNQLAQGKAFTELAKTYSQDESTKQFGGDAGTTSVNGVLPELRPALTESKTGDVKLAASRYGLHLLKVVDKSGEGDNTQVHLQQIFLPTSGYDSWYQEQVKSIKVVRLLHFS